MPKIFRNLLTTGDQPILWHSQHMLMVHTSIFLVNFFDPWNENSTSKWYCGDNVWSPSCRLLHACWRTPSPSNQMSPQSSRQLPERTRTAWISRSCAAAKIQWRGIQGVHCFKWLIIAIILIILIMSLHPGSCRSWPHRSRVAGLMIPWMISFILPCVLDGFHTSGTPIQIELQRQDQPSCRQQDQPTGHFDSGGWCLKLCSSYSCWLGSFRQWIFSRIAISKFGIMRTIVQIIAIIVK